MCALRSHLITYHFVCQYFYFPILAYCRAFIDFLFHFLRYSHTSLLIIQDFDTLTITECLGQEKISIILNNYSHLFPHKQGKLFQNLQNLLNLKIHNADERTSNHQCVRNIWKDYLNTKPSYHFYQV